MTTTTADLPKIELKGEREAVLQVLAIGEKWGYGNLIFRLQRAWALHLYEKFGLSLEAALAGARVATFRDGCLTDAEKRGLLISLRAATFADAPSHAAEDIPAGGRP